MSALRSSTMVFTESRVMLKPVKSNTKSNIRETAKRDMLLRTKKLSLDSDSFMKSLQGKYEHKEPKPPPVLGLGVRRYKGTKSCLGPTRDVSLDQEELFVNRTSHVEHTRKKSGLNECHLQKIREETDDCPEPNTDINNVSENFTSAEKDAQEEVESKLQEVHSEVERIMDSLANDDLDLESPAQEADSKTDEHHEAAANGDVAALKRLLKQGCDVNIANDIGSTPLQMACDNGHTLAVRILANNGGDLNVVDGQGRSLVHMAVFAGRAEMVAALMLHHARTDTRDQRRGRTPLHLAALENELVMIELLVHELQDDPWAAQPLLSITDKDGRTPLHVAASKGNVEAARLLLSVGFSVTRKDLYGHTPMHAALQLNHVNKRCRFMLRLLLEAGGDLSIKDEHPSDGEDFQQGKQTRGEQIDEELALYKESKERGLTTEEDTCDLDSNHLNENGVRRLSSSSTTCGRTSKRNSIVLKRRSSGAWVDEGVEQVERMIHMAARVGCGGCLALLIEYGAPVNSRDRQDRTPLHLAAETSRPNAARTLVQLGADLEAMDSRAHTPLHAAIGADSSALVEALLDLGADIDQKDSMGRSYAECALFSRKLDSFKCLIKRGVSAVSEEGSSILHSSASLGCLTTCQLLLEMGWASDTSDSGGLTPLHTTIGQGHEDIATLLITEGASITKRDNKGATPLHYAVRWGGSDALLRMLVKRGASVAAKDRLGRTPLHYAASKSSIMSDLYIILGGGADINAADLSGLAPLHLAARFGNESLVRILLDRGAVPTLKDMYNFTPLDHATENNHFSIIKRLEDYITSYKNNDGTHHYHNGVGDHTDDEVKEVTQKSKQAAFQSRGSRTSVAW